MILRRLFCTLAILLPVWSMHGGGLTHHEREILATCLVLEAASEGVEGMTAVLNVIHNRAQGDIHRTVTVAVAKGQFASMKPVWTQEERDYSALIARAQKDRMYSAAYKLVLEMEQGHIADITNGATHFHTVDSQPFWAKHLQYLTTIGAHHFYVEI